MDKSNKLNDIWTSRWNDRYSKEEFAYGEEPNNYLKEQLTEKLKSINYQKPVGELVFLPIITSNSRKGDFDNVKLVKFIDI